MSPERILGRSIFWLMDKLGILRASREMRVGRYLMRTDPFPGKALGLGRLRRRGIRVGLGDWVAIPEAKDEHGNFLHKRGFSLRGLVSTSSDTKLAVDARICPVRRGRRRRRVFDGSHRQASRPQSGSLIAQRRQP